MRRVIAIDYGSVRIGIAISDPLKMFARPYDTIQNKGDESVINKIREIIESEDVELIVVGLPLNMEGEDTAQTTLVREFFASLREQTDIPLVWQDERFTSQEANAGLKRKRLTIHQSRARIDKTAAAVILQRYLDKES
ncbi:MAG: Holliday junction resolvase RuvX [Candidatus Cloacimonetes bacterium]|nr:Holliday junction resolvase RuvX [Candidatus Cloacimonadota bacterium]